MGVAARGAEVELPKRTLHRGAPDDHRRVPIASRLALDQVNALEPQGAIAERRQKGLVISDVPGQHVDDQKVVGQYVPERSDVPREQGSKECVLCSLWLR